MRRYLFCMILCVVVLASAVMAADSGPRMNRLAGDTLQQFTPATHYIWTDKLWYTAGETLNLYWTADAQGDPYPYTIFIKLVNLETGGRSYVANNGVSTELQDAFGNTEGNYAPTTLPAVAKQKMLTFPAPSKGVWHFVAELRDVSGKQVIKSAWAKFTVVDGEVQLGWDGTDTEVSADTTWTRDKVYRLRYQVFVNDGATLTIEPGTVVVASGQNAVIVVERGGKLIADGRKEMPIVMTCDANVGSRSSGCWAGLILLGKAKINVTGGQETAEGVIPADRPAYGGDDDSDSSGVYRYLRVEFAGVDFTAEIQPNAFGFHGVGSGTVIDHIQAHDGEDDGIEFFGGAANMKYFVSDGSKDDSLDWTHGWSGKAQYGYIRQDNVDADSGIEADNWDKGHNNEPRSNPLIFDVTFVGSEVGSRGFRLRRGSAATFKNFIVMGFPRIGFQADDQATLDKMADGTTQISHGVFWMNAGGSTMLQPQISTSAWDYISAQPNIAAVDPLLRNTRYEGNPDPRPTDASPVCSVGKAANAPSDGFYQTGSTCAGAFSHQDNWLDEWTFFGDEADYMVP